MGGESLHPLKSKKGFSLRSLTTAWVGYSINWVKLSYHLKSVTKDLKSVTKEVRVLQCLYSVDGIPVHEEGITATTQNKQVIRV